MPQQCSQFCYISADQVELNFWPTPYPSQTAELNATAVGNLSAQITPPPPNPSTVVRDGFTFISPSVYVVYSGLKGVNDIFGDVGSSYDNLTIGYHPSELSTVNWCNTCGVTQALNFQDFNTPVQWSVISEQYGCAFYGHSYSTNLLPQSHRPADLVTDYNDLSEYIGFDSTNPAQDWVLKPVIDLPPGLTDVDPAWKGCRKWTGVWDPPRPLFSVDGPGVVDWGSVPKPQVVPQPAITPAAPIIHSQVPAMAPAVPQLPAKQTPAPQTPNADPGHGFSSESADPGQQSPGDSPEGDNSPDSTGTGSGGDPPGSDSDPVDDSGQHESPPDPAGDPKGDESSGSTDSGSTDSGSTDSGTDSDPPGSSVPEPVDDSNPQQLPSPQTGNPIDSSAGNSDSGSEGPNSGGGDPGNGDNPKPGDPAVENGGNGQSDNDESGSDPKTPSPSIDSSGDGQSDNDSSGGEPQPEDPAVGNGGDGQPDNGGSEHAPSIPAGPSGTPEVVHPSPNGIPAPELISAPFVEVNPSPKPVLTVGGSPVAIDHSGNVAIGGSALSAGGSGLDVSGTPVSVLPNRGGLLVDGKTIPIPPPPTPAPNVDPVVGVVAAGKTWTPAGPSAVAADGQTLRLGSSAIDIGGTPVSLNPAGIVAGPSTIPLPISNQKPVAWMVADQPFTKLSQDVIVAEGQTLSLGSEPKVIGGKTFSWGSGGLVVGTSTLGVPSLDQSAPTPGPAVATFAAAGETFTPVAGNQVVVDGVTVTPGGAPKSVDGRVISLGDTGMVVDGSTFAIPSATLRGVSGSNVFTAGSQTITSLSPTAIAISGHTFTSGAPAATMSGHTFSFGASGVIIDRSSTIALPTVLPSLSPQSDGHFDTFSEIASNVVAIDGVLITQGAPPKTIDGDVVSWGSDDLVVGTSTVALSTGTQGVDELGSLILGGFGPEETGPSTSLTVGESPTATSLFDSAAQRSRGFSKGWQASWLRVFVMIIGVVLYT